MKPVAVTIFTVFAVALSSAAEDRVLNDLAKIKDSAEMIFVEERALPNNEFEWIPTGTPFSVGEEDKKVLENLSKLKVGDSSNTPVIGDLGAVALKDREGKVIAIIGVVELASEFWIMEARSQDKKFVHVEDGFFKYGESLEFARWMYSALTKRWPRKMKMREAEWISISPNDRSIVEAIRVYRNESQQAGADQPATAPESKPERKEKPQPESKPASR